MRWLAGRLCAAAVVTASLLAGADAHAEPAPGQGKYRIEWNYPKFRLAEVSLTVGLFLTTTYVESRAFKYGDYAPDNGWHNGLLFDDAGRGLAGSTTESRTRAAHISNWFWHGTQYFPVVVDGLLMPLVFDKFNTEAALQMTLLNWEAQTIAFFFVRFGHRIVGRRRPYHQECANDPGYEPGCNGGYDRNASFPGGHTAMAFTGAGLTCIHHYALPVYGSDALGKAVCGLALAAATTTAALRMVAEQHWATDNIIGALIGLGSGAGVPYLLHYAPHYRKHGAFVTMMPWTDGRDGGGVAVMATH